MGLRNGFKAVNNYITSFELVKIYNIIFG